MESWNVGFNILIKVLATYSDAKKFNKTKSCRNAKTVRTDKRKET